MFAKLKLFKMWRYLLVGFLIGVISTLIALQLLNLLYTEDLEEIEEVPLDDADLEPTENFPVEQYATPSFQLQNAEDLTNF